MWVNPNAPEDQFCPTPLKPPIGDISSLPGSLSLEETHSKCPGNVSSVFLGIGEKTWPSPLPWSHNLGPELQLNSTD